MTGRPADAVSRALAQMQSGQLKQAEATLRQDLRRSPRNARAAHLLGLVLSQSGQAEQAEFFLLAAARDAPGSAEIRTALGNHRAMAGRHGDAAEAFRAAIKLDPHHTAAHLGLALSSQKLGDSEAAVAAGREAVRLAPGAFQACVNLASVLKDSGRAEEALGVLREARERIPRSVPVLTALLSTLNYVDVDPREISLIARELAGTIGVPPPVQLTSDRDPDRKLRIGFISGDLRTHSVAYFLEPILESRDRAQIETVCFSTSRKSDSTTERLRALSDGWVDASGLSGEAFIRRAREEKIDIAIDLSGHTSGSRVLALAQRAAPVQVTYLGYPGTTGVPAIDYRIVDFTTDPHGAEALATERLLRLDRCFLVYAPPGDAPAVGVRDVSAPVTFGSFNAAGKITAGVIRLWSRVLQQIPGSRLLLKNKALSDRAVAARLLAQFESSPVEQGRIEILGHAPDVRSHLDLYSRIDVALDTAPYNGTTTTCEALWMGVPVVTLRGRTHAGRVGASLLECVGLKELIADDEQGFVAIAERLSRDRECLARMRDGLRRRVWASPLCDRADFATHFHAALRSAWRSWCESSAR